MRKKIKNEKKYSIDSRPSEQLLRFDGSGAIKPDRKPEIADNKKRYFSILLDRKRLSI